MIKPAFLLIIALILAVSLSVTPSINALGTTLPALSNSMNYRVFNDLMKQSLPIVPYQKTSWGSIGRYWGFNLTYIDGLSQNYPSILPTNVYAVAQIPFFAQDKNLLNQTYILKFKGNGTVGVLQTGLYNVTWGSGTGGQFVLKAVNQSLFVYIYLTSITDPVNSVTIVRKSLGSGQPLFTENFLNYLKPFTLLRTCFWQGQNIYNSGKALQIWNNRTLISASTQISSSGVALEHILQLQKYGVTIWPCIPDTADTNYITQMGTLFASKRTKSNIIYIQYGNVFTIMNDFPDARTTPAFSTFLQAYGVSYRQKIVFTINYKDIQYYINAMGMRSPPVDFTYIDAIGAEAAFGTIDATQQYGTTDQQLKTWILHKQLSYQTTLNKAFQLAKRNQTDFVTFSGGPYLKTPKYGWNFRYTQDTSNLTLQQLATKQTTLYNRLTDLVFHDSWTQQLYLHWIARLKSIGIKTLMFSELIGKYSTDTDRIPILSNLTSTTTIWDALNDYSSKNRATTLITSGKVPQNSFICSPSCVWGDCVSNSCVCYAGYSGIDCSIYTAPNVQNKVGVNLQGVSYWTTQHPFIDMSKQGSSWVYFVINQGWSSGEAFKDQVPLDSDGYPTSLPSGITVGTLIARDVETHYDNGTYTILYDGDGTLTFGMFDVLKVKYGIGRVEVVVQPSTNGNNGLLVTIERTNPSNPVKNIRVIRPGFEGIWQAVRFSPLLLEKLQPFGTLRFMDWTNTNGQKDVQWADRTLTSQRTYVENGVAWQDTIQLCNTLGKHAWINIPHKASDDYIQKLAQLFRDKLEPHLKVYVQYSNEVWGTLFPGGQYAQNQGMIMNLAASDPTEARFCYLGLRTNQISTIWNAVFSDDSRVNIIISTQAVNADTTRRIIACQSSYNFIDGVAIAPYLSVELTDTMTYDQIIAALETEITKIGTMIQTHLTYTNPHNLPLLCYESGQGLLGSTTTQTNLAMGVQFYDSMREVYLKYHEILFNNSIVLANHYCDSVHYTKYGSWGIFQYIDDKPEKSKKWLGLLDYFTEQSLPTGVQTYGACDKNCSGNGICSFGQCLCYSDFNGSNCSNGKYVDYIDCGYLCTFNQGTCGLKTIVGNNRYFGCTCFPGYTGIACSIAICDSKCSYAGNCVSPNNCSCLRGRAGSNCEIDCGCGGHGACNADKSCLCDAGYTYSTASKKCEFTCNGQASSKCYGPNLFACSSCVGGTCNNGTCVCWPGFTGADCATEETVNYVNDNMGINVGGLSYWSTQHLFKNFFKQSSQWVSQYYPGYFNGSIQYTWNTEQSFPTRPDGYPSSLYANMSLGKLLLRDIKKHYPNITKTNKYVLLYDGDGILELGFDAKATQISYGRIKFQVTPSIVLDNGVYVKIITTNPSNPIRNIRVFLEGDEYNFEQDLLAQNFMTYIKQFSTIRFMDLLNTNGNPVSEWNETTPSDFHTQAVQTGISFDLVSKLIRRTGRNAWINVPHKASDDYVTKLANFLKDNIPTKRIIYVEYSNEVWNAFFEQGKYATAQAATLGLSNYHKFYAKRSLQIFNIFSSVFGDNSPRLKFVISYQAVSKWVADQILTYNQVINGITVKLSDVVDIVAGAPYYDCDSIGNTLNTAKVAAGTPADVLQTCANNFASLVTILQTEKDVSAAYANLPMATYEAGTGISEQQTIYSGAETPSATANFIAANRDPGMYDVYKTLLNTYKSNGLFSTAPTMLFSSIGLPSKYGSWGMLDYLDQIEQSPTHPKFQAVIDFNKGI